MPRNALYAQSGGVTSVINASASALILAARTHSAHIDHVYAGRNGIVGALDEDLIDTNLESSEAITALAHTPGGAFGSCRHKLRSPQDNEAEYKRLIDVFKAHDIGYFFYNGGGDSMDTANKVSGYAASLGLDVKSVGVPKTIDNDLPITDCCPGFGSAAKYIAVSTSEVALDVASMCATSTKLFVLEVMGRHAGWLAAAAGLAGRGPNDAPQIILFPEVPFDKTRFLARVEQSIAENGYCVVVVSEGVRDRDGKFLSERGTRDSFGHAQLGGAGPAVAELVQEALGLKYHWAVADYMQRSARHLASATDVAQAKALGEAAVELAVQGETGVMPTIERVSDDPYEWRIGKARLEDVANVEKTMPNDFVSEDGFGISEAARTYLNPLIAGEDYPAYHQGLPRWAVLKRISVARKLASRAP
ncbi:MAG: 6-phosphofructokinase [Gammaproteobacteria bacterium]|nr:6-phosphofructokinase [Gammaproteobacteria bacterium]